MKKLFENKRLAGLSKIFRPFSKFYIILFPNLSVELKQAEYKINAVTYTSIALFLSAIHSILLAAVLLVSANFFELFTRNNIIFIIIISLLLYFISVLNLINTSKNFLAKKAKEIDISLLFALRHMLVKVKSGIPLFNSIVGVAFGDYGAVSEEFRKVVREIEGGTNELIALEKAGFHNPSSFFRRFVWQITNSLRAGTDVAQTLEVIVKSLEEERYLQIKAFGSRLSPIALMYIMFTIIVPALGTTFLTIFSVFFGRIIPPETFFAVPVIILLSNMLFINIIKSTRPLFEMN